MKETAKAHSSARLLATGLPPATAVEADAVHMNGVPLLRVAALQGALLGITHVITTSTWSAPTSEVVYGYEKERKGKWHKNPDGKWEKDAFQPEPELPPTTLLAASKDYDHFFVALSPQPPFNVLAISKQPIPLQMSMSSAPWFEECNMVQYIRERRKWPGHANTTACALQVAFVSGMQWAAVPSAAQDGDSCTSDECQNDRIMISYGHADERTRFLQLSIREISSLFGNDAMASLAAARSARLARSSSR